LLILLCSTKKG